MILSEIVQRLQPGDVFASRGSGMMSMLIRFGQWLEDCGESAPYNHIGGVVHAAAAAPALWFTVGETVESKTVIGRYHLKDYLGEEIIIARHVGMSRSLYKKGIVEVLDNIGQVYPSPRILLHAVDMVRGHVWKKITGRSPKLKMCDFSITGDWPVCSELWAQFFLAAGLPTGFPEDKEGTWKGVTPDDFYDAWRSRLDLWSVIECGKLLSLK